MSINTGSTTAEKISATGRWKKGSSGNPAGRPVGSRNKSTLLVEQMMQNDSEELVAKLRELALEGNAFALRFLMERLSPRPKERLIYLPLPKITNSQDAVEAETRILEAVGQGEITIGEGAALTKLVGAHRAHANIAALQSAPKPAQYNTTKSPLHYSSEDEIDDFSFGGDDIPGETEPGWHGSNSNVSAATRTELSGNGDPKPTWMRPRLKRERSRAPRWYQTRNWSWFR